MDGHSSLIWDGILGMEEVMQLAWELFEIEKNHLLEEKHEYSCAVAIVLTPGGRYYEEAEFDDENEMYTVYGAIVRACEN